LKTSTLRDSPAKPASPGTKSVTGKTYAPPPRLAPKSAPKTARSVVAGEERRGSQRVLLRVRATIHLAVEGKPVTLEATTLSVNSHGALVLLQKSLPVETRLVLEHGGTKEKVSCRVARPAREMPEGFHIPIEFDSPSPNFWQIRFPPTDWRPPDEI
jgi:hypothetical protein